ncbi:MAG: signal peptidase I [Bacteroidales bacterium]|nr:signal peptidase I [Bacteroidales bacterium]
MKKTCISIVLSFLSVPLLYGVWLLIRVFVMDYFTIPTESMCPTLQPGDKVVVNKLIMGARIYTNLDFNPEGQQLESFRTKGTRMIRYNDIAVFNFANHWGEIKFIINNVFCKRVIGLPGDSISAVNGHYVNNNFDGVLGLETEQDRLAQLTDSTTGGYWVPPYYCQGWNVLNFGPLYVPRKGDIMQLRPLEALTYMYFLEWELGKKITLDWGKNEVYADGKLITEHQFQHNYYFMAGDNVANSDDSRYWGPVPEEYIVGVVGLIIRGSQFIIPNEEHDEDER